MWGIKYEKGDILLNDKVEGDAFTLQGLEIWKATEVSEYRGGYGMNKGFFALSSEACYDAIISKISEEVHGAKNAGFMLSKTEEGKINIEINFIYEN